MSLRNLFLWLSAAFWLAVAYYAVCCTHNTAPVAAPLSLSSKPSAQLVAAIANRLPVLTGIDLSRHSTADDCWVAISGVIYDVTNYLSEHPDKNKALDGYCGRDGTKSWNAKESGREKGEAHTIKSHQIMAELPRAGLLKK